MLEFEIWTPWPLANCQQRIPLHTRLEKPHTPTVGFWHVTYSSQQLQCRVYRQSFYYTLQPSVRGLLHALYSQFVTRPVPNSISNQWPHLRGCLKISFSCCVCFCPAMYGCVQHLQCVAECTSCTHSKCVRCLQWLGTAKVDERHQQPCHNPS